MKLLGKHISAAFSLAKPEEGLLFGFEVCPGETECCGQPVMVTRIGLGFGEVDIFVQEDHKH